MRTSPDSFKDHEMLQLSFTLIESETLRMNYATTQYLPVSVSASFGNSESVDVGTLTQCCGPVMQLFFS